MIERSENLRVALVAANLSQGGAEKQAVYMAKALRQAGVTVQIYTLSRGQHYEHVLRQSGLEPCWVGRARNPLLRLGSLARQLRHFRPHVIQATHSFANLYAGLLGRLFRTASIGALRCSLQRCQNSNRGWTRLLLTTPTALIVNSQVVQNDLLTRGLLPSERIFLLPNAIDLTEYDTMAPAIASHNERRPTAIMVGRLERVKRAERFLHALALTAKEEPAVCGLVVGDGPDRPALERQALELGIESPRLRFLGQRDDVPRLLLEADMLVHCADDEGRPNIVLEAMAARLPVIATPAGDVRTMIQDGLNGYLVPFDDPQAIASRVVRLARNPHLRTQMGIAGRYQVERLYGFDRLAEQLLSIYHVLLERS